MSDPLRTDPASDPLSEAGRDAKIEQLLLAGLDHYLDGQFDQAINVWTRALFLDRSHARARAYIERARSALAEQQRESEELLQRGLAAFDGGASREARRLLEAAIRRGAPRDEALLVLDRIERLSPTTDPGAERSALAELVPDFASASAARPRLAAALTTAAWVAFALAVAAAFVVAGRLSVDWNVSTPPPPAVTAPVTPPVTDTGLVVPRRGERALSRARRLADSGRLRDALVTLEQVSVTDEERTEADRLRTEIQRRLLALGPRTGEAASLAPVPGSTP